MTSRRLAARQLAATLLALLITTGCGKPVSEWDRLQRAIASARQAQNHPRAVELSRQLVLLARETPPVDSTRLVQGYDLLQQSLVGAGDYHAALEYQTHLVGLMDGMRQPDSTTLRRLLVDAADCARRTGKPDAAEASLARAVQMHRASGFIESKPASQAIAALAQTNAARGRFAQAESLQKLAILVRDTSPDTASLDRAQMLASLAGIVDQRGRAAEAESLYAQALRTAERTFGADHPMAADLYLAFGGYLHAHSRHAEAVPVLEQGLRLSAASPAYDAAARAARLHELAGSHSRLGDWASARESAELAIALRENSAPDAGPLPRAWVNDLAIIYVQLGRSAAAESLLTRYPENRPDPER